MHPLLTSKALVIAVLLLLGVTTLLTFGYKSVSSLRGEDGSVKKQVLNPKNVIQVSTTPRVFLYRNFLSKEECDHIIEIGETKLSRSMVVGANGQAIVDNARTSYGTFLSSFASDPVLMSLTDRIAEWSQIPGSHGEDFYLLRYQLGQEYKAHHDFFDENTAKKLGRPGNRIVTILMYLSDVDAGGETYFPRAATGEFTVAPHKGDAVMFFDFSPDLQPDPSSLHGSKPVAEGTKWSLTRWIRMRNFR